MHQEEKKNVLRKEFRLIDENGDTYLSPEDLLKILDKKVFLC